MQVLVRKSDIAADCTCGICGQGFRLYAENGTAEQQVRMKIEVRDAIHAQHVSGAGRTAHPEVPFTVPNWQGVPQFAFPARPALRISGVRSAALEKARAS